MEGTLTGSGDDLRDVRINYFFQFMKQFEPRLSNPLLRGHSPSIISSSMMMIPYPFLPRHWLFFAIAPLCVCVVTHCRFTPPFRDFLALPPSL